MSLLVSGVVRITKDLELKQAGNTTVCNFSVAKNKAFSKDENDKTNFYDCVAFGKTAENLCKFKSKGEEIYIEGTYEIDKWQNEAGENRYKHKINVRNIQFIGGKSEGKSNNQSELPNDFQEVDDCDIPF